MLEQGGVESSATWKRILRAVDELQRESPEMVINAIRPAPPRQRCWPAPLLSLGRVGSNGEGSQLPTLQAAEAIGAPSQNGVN
jgi:hypothetical protein